VPADTSGSKRQLPGPLAGHVGHPDGLLAHGPGGVLPGNGLLGAGPLGAHGPGLLGAHGPGLLGAHGPGLLGAHAGPLAGHGHLPGHPVTHPGFSTLGYPGHAMATLDIKVCTLLLTVIRFLGQLETS
jgi:hypothetical protein